jgi:hypothetical protein
MIIGIILAVLIIVAIVVTSILKKKKIAKLDASIKRLQAESTAKNEAESRVTLTPYVEDYVEEENKESASDEEKPEEKSSMTPIIEDLSDIDIFNFDDDEDEDFDVNISDFDRKEDEDFEDFLDTHSYTRKIIDKDLLKRFGNLSPEMKDILLSNMFNKYDD